MIICQETVNTRKEVMISCSRFYKIQSPVFAGFSVSYVSSLIEEGIVLVLVRLVREAAVRGSEPEASTSLFPRGGA